jgi:glutamine synthetase
MPAPEPLNEINVYQLSREERVEQNIAELPGSLAEALHILDADQVLKDALGPSAYESFERAKWAEVEEYRTKVTDWELDRYLETT